jgi:hypothetical protein
MLYYLTAYVAEYWILLFKFFPQTVTKESECGGSQYKGAFAITILHQHLILPLDEIII